MRTRKLVLIGVLVGFGAVMHILESLVPLPLAVPGAKLGLANAATLVALELAGPVPALSVAILRPFLGGLVSGGLMSVGFFLSLSGAVLSGLVMVCLWTAAAGQRGRATGHLTLAGVSLAGGVAHNLGQLAAASFYVGAVTALAYLGPLILAGLASGYIVGRLASAVAGSTAVRASLARLAPG